MENIRFWQEKSSKSIGFTLEIMRFRYEKSAKAIKLKYKQLRTKLKNKETDGGFGEGGFLVGGGL